MKRIRFYFFCTLLGISQLSLVSCKKYEEGPVISLRPKEERVANTWRAQRVTQNGKDKTGDYSSLIFTFTKEGTYTYSIPAWNAHFSGTWRFDGDKEAIITRANSAFATDDIYNILKLKEDEMWVYDVNDGIEYRLVPA
jgi:hypothetical protein